MRLRILVVIALVFVALSIFTDPYAHNLNGSDVLLPAPTWQAVAALVDIALLLTAGVVELRNRSSVATKLLAGEFLYAVAVNALLIRRDGVERFIWGFGAQRHVLDFVVVFGLRTLVLLALLQAVRRRDRRAA